MRKYFFLLALFYVTPIFATIFGTVRGTVHDPQHRLIEGAQVKIHSKTSEWSQTMKTDAEGKFEFSAVPVGEYAVLVTYPGFSAMEQPLEVTSSSVPVLRFELKLEPISAEVEVSAAPVLVNPESSTTQNLLSREEIAETPGADRTDSLAMITDYVPGAYMVHDQLHVRGGHQITWQIDGVPVPNTNIASKKKYFLITTSDLP